MMYLASTLEEDLNIENPTFIEELFSTFNWKDIAQQMISASVRILFDYYAPSGPPIRPIESFNIQLESTGTQIESSKIAMPISA